MQTIGFDRFQVDFDVVNGNQTTIYCHVVPRIGEKVALPDYKNALTVIDVVHGLVGKGSDSFSYHLVPIVTVEGDLTPQPKNNDT